MIVEMENYKEYELRRSDIKKQEKKQFLSPVNASYIRVF